MAGTVNFKGNPLTLEGMALKIGGKAPDFSVVAQDMKDVTLADYEGKVKVITTFLSLDTSLCDLQVKEFNKKATEFSPDVVVLGISKDLPFAQKRFCETFKIDKVHVLSDYKTSSFGINYGLLIKELNLLARSVLILDKDNNIRYFQLVDEATNPPDYEDTVRNLEEIVKNP